MLGSSVPFSERRSLPDLRSTPDRLSPTRRFSSSDRLSVPDRLSFAARLPVPDLFPPPLIFMSPLVAETHTERRSLTYSAGYDPGYWPVLTPSGLICTRRFCTTIAASNDPPTDYSWRQPGNPPQRRTLTSTNGGRDGESARSERKHREKPKAATAEAARRQSRPF